jgi:hypothetical protein
VLLVAFTPPPHRPIRYPDDLGSFPPLQLAGHRLQYHFLNLHHPLHFRGRDLFHFGLHTLQLPLPLSLSGHFIC